MAETVVLHSTFLLRRGKSATWTKNNPTLSLGEPGFEVDTYKLKIGDGATAWNDLAYFGGDFTVSLDNKSITFNDAGQIALYGLDTAEVGQVPSKGEDGFLRWVEPSGDEPMDDEDIHHIIDN